MHRGLLQGAPESPVLFTLVTDAVFAPLEEEWRRKGWGWGMDGLHIAASRCMHTGENDCRYQTSTSHGRPEHQ
eukprot:9129227-Prorocentrum_lima.AAC.1